MQPLNNLNKTRKRRLNFIFFVLFVSTLITSLVTYALRQNINLFFTPTEIAGGKAPKNARIRIGGMVLKNSVLKKADLNVHFILTDFKQEIKVQYRGILPDLFREGQGIVAMGKMDADHIFIADEILAKHDENYMPPEISTLLQAQK